MFKFYIYVQPNVQAFSCVQVLCLVPLKKKYICRLVIFKAYNVYIQGYFVYDQVM